MTTTPEATKGVPRHPGNSSFTPRADHNALADWVRDNVSAQWPTFATLPTTENWVGRMYWVVDVGALFLWNGAAWRPVSPCFAYFQGVVSPTTGVNGDIPSSQKFSTPGPLSVGTNAIIVGVSGWYHIEGSVSWASNNSGARVLELTVDGNPITYRLASRDIGNSSNAQTISGRRYFTAGQVLRLRVTQDSGATLAATGALSVEYVLAGSAPA